MQAADPRVRLNNDPGEDEGDPLGPRIDVISIADPTKPTRTGVIDLSPWGAVVNSVAVKNGVKLKPRSTRPRASRGG